MMIFKNLLNHVTMDVHVLPFSGKCNDDRFLESAIVFPEFVKICLELQLNISQNILTRLNVIARSIMKC